MTKIFVAIICVFFVLLFLSILALFVQKKVYQAKLKKMERDFLKRWNSMQSRQEEILKNAKQKKESLHSGNSDTNFNNSLNVLQNLAAGRKKRGDSD